MAALAAAVAAEAPAPAPAAAGGQIGDAEMDGLDEAFVELAPAVVGGRPHLSPIRLRMGWRRNGELEMRTSELQHLLDVLKPPGEKADVARSKAATRQVADAAVRRFGTQQARLDLLERELDAHRDAKNQAITSRAEMVKRFEEEKKRADDLDKQLTDCRSKLSRAQRQIELLKAPAQPAVEEAAGADKSKPLHMRLNEEKQKKEEKLEAIKQQAEQGRTYAPRIDPTSSNMA